MGNCCGPKAIQQTPVLEYKREQYKLPRIIVMPEDSALIYLDPTPTLSSHQLRESLKNKFPNLVSSDSDKRILNQIKMMKERKFYIIIVGAIREETLRLLLASVRVRAIYFCLEQVDLGSYAKSSKIKGFFKDQRTLKNTIYNNVRADDVY